MGCSLDAKIANKKVLNESIEDEEEFEDWDSEGFDDVCEGDMEDWDFDYGEEYSYKTPSEELEDHLADCFPTRYGEYPDDEADLDSLSNEIE